MGTKAERKRTTALNRHWAQVAAEDPEALSVVQMCEGAKVTLLRYPANNGAYKVRETIAVSAIRDLIEARGAERAREVLDVLAGAELAPIKGEHVQAADILLNDPTFNLEIDTADITDSFLMHGGEIEAEAKTFAKNHHMSAARALASVWHRKTRKKRRVAT